MVQRTHMLGLGAICLALATTSCDTPTTVSQFDHATAHPAYSHTIKSELTPLAKDVQKVTARYNSLKQATQDGYAVASPCIEAPGLGGMGFHYVNDTLVDPTFDALNPEAVLYEPDKHGKLKFVAVEYIVIDIGQPAPTFGGQPFDVGGTPLPIPHWSLHVWVNKSNPNGLFTPFNPDVSCS